MIYISVTSIMKARFQTMFDLPFWHKMNLITEKKQIFDYVMKY